MVFDCFLDFLDSCEKINTGAAIYICPQPRQLRENILKIPVG